MAETWMYVDDDDDIRQGDIIRRYPSGHGSNIQQLGVVITADCDIAQKKSGNRFTILEIFPGQRYLDEYWAPDQIGRLLDKQVKIGLDGLNGVIKKKGAELSPLTSESLSDWLSSRTADEILTTLSPSPKKLDEKLLTTLRALRIAYGHEGPSQPLERLRATWSAMGKDRTWQMGQIKGGFDGEHGFPDFFFVPELPQTEGYGFIIMLRVISSITRSDLYKSEAAARIDDNPTAYHRIGRFSDRVRYAVSQKFAFLFSRIGMPRKFEDACDMASEIIVTMLNAESANV